MGQRMRTYDWSTTPLGPVNTWPQSLRTTLSIILSSRFPMFLFWGPSLLCFYNDAYRPSLGNDGKHPHALGKPGEEVWPEIWHIIKPLIDQVLAGGEATWSEDQLIPIYRNGKMEDVYWTFSYSAVYDESGRPAGVFVTCTETTEKVKVFRDFRESEERFRGAVAAVQSILWTNNAKGEMEGEQPGWASLTGQSYEQYQGYGWAAAIHPEDSQPTIDQWNEAVRERKMFVFHHRVRLRNGDWGWFSIRALPLLNSDGTIREWVGVHTDVTEQRQAEQALKESTEFFRTLADNIQNLAWMANGEGWIFWYNKRWYEYTGTTLEEMEGWGWEKVHHPDHIGRVTAFVKEAWQKNTPWELTFPLRGADGDYRWFLTRVYPILNATGEVIRWIGTNTDITEQKQAEEKFRYLANQLPMWVWMADKHVNVTYANSELLNYIGIAHFSDFTGQVWEQVVHPEDVPVVHRVFDESYNEQKPYEIECRFKNAATGAYEWFSIKGVPRIENDVFAGFIGTGFNIQQRKILTENLELQVAQRTTELIELNKTLENKNTDLSNTQHFLQTVLDSSVELVCAFDARLNYTFVNKKAEEFMGIQAADIIGKNIAEVSSKVTEYTNYEQMQKALAGELVYTQQKEVSLDKNSVLESYFIPLKRDGKVTGIVTLSRDITPFIRLTEKLKQANQELERTNTNLQRSNEDLQQFAHVASHDLKEPVRKIKLFGNFLSREFADHLPETGKLYLHKIQHSADRMYTMIDGVLSYSSLSAAQQLMEKVDLSEVLRSIESDLEVVIEQKKAILTYTPLPVIEGSSILLYQLFYNLINNALKFSRTDSRPLITVESEVFSNATAANNPYLRIRVKDNGIGFSTEEAQKIFKTFVRLNSKDEYEGTGLGLALCQRIVERHGGSINAEGQPGKGAVFVVDLPMQHSQSLV